jgi:hypothetical protein
LLKRIEEGIGQVLSALSSYPCTIDTVLKSLYDDCSSGNEINGCFSGFNDTSYYPDKAYKLSIRLKLKKSDDDEEEEEVVPLVAADF